MPVYTYLTESLCVHAVRKSREKEGAEFFAARIVHIVLHPVHYLISMTYLNENADTEYNHICQ